MIISSQYPMYVLIMLFVETCAVLPSMVLNTENSTVQQLMIIPSNLNGKLLLFMNLYCSGVKINLGNLIEHVILTRKKIL